MALNGFKKRMKIWKSAIYRSIIEWKPKLLDKGINLHQDRLFDISKKIEPVPISDDYKEKFPAFRDIPMSKPLSKNDYGFREISLITSKELEDLARTLAGKKNEIVAKNEMAAKYNNMHKAHEVVNDVLSAYNLNDSNTDLKSAQERPQELSKKDLQHAEHKVVEWFQEIYAWKNVYQNVMAKRDIIVAEFDKLKTDAYNINLHIERNKAHFDENGNIKEEGIYFPHGDDAKDALQQIQNELDKKFVLILDEMDQKLGQIADTPHG